ncbi:MAG: MFS transporter [Methanohalobium sp.]
MKRLVLPVICLVAFFGMTGSALMGPVLPDMVDPLNSTREAVGWVMGIFTLSNALFMMLLGTRIDNLSHRKVLVISLTVNGLAGIAGFFAPNLPVLLVFRFIQGIGTAGMMPLVMTMIGELYESFERVHAMGRVSMTTSVGEVTAPFIGGGLAGISWNYPFLFYGLTIPLAVVAVFVLPETNATPLKRKTGIYEVVLALKNINVAYTIFMAFALFFLLFTIIIYVPFLLKDNFGFTAQGAGIALGVQGASMAVVASQAKRLSLKFSKKTITGVGFAVMGTAIIGMAGAYHLPLVFVLLLLFGIGFGVLIPFINTLITQVAPGEVMGGVVSIFNTMKFVGMTASSVVLGLILLTSNLETVFIVSGLLGFGVVLMNYFVYKIL